MASMFKSTRLVGGMTMISRVFGMVRDVVLARIFGAGLGFDVFIVAFKIPNFLRRLFAEGGFSQAFVPVLSEYREKKTKEEVQALIDHTSATLGLILFFISIVGVIAAPVLISIFAPGFIDAGNKFELASDMLRITFPYILFISLTAFAGGILNTYRHFSVPAFTPVFLNLSLIACAIWLAPHFPEDKQVVALAWGVLIAGIIQLGFQIPFLIKLGLLPFPRFNRDKEGVSRILKLMVPTLFAASITQINLLVDTLIASFLQTGSISWLYYSDRMVELPLGVFGVALATVILPNLSAEHAKGDSNAYGKILTWALGLVFLISLPAAFGLALLSAPILTTLFQYAEFTTNDVLMSSKSLIAYSVGLPGFILIKVLSSAFFSRQDTRTPVKIAVVAMVSNIVLNLLLVKYLGHAGLALATSISAYINAGLLFIWLRKTDLTLSLIPVMNILMKSIIAIIAMSTVLIYAVPEIGLWFEWGASHRILLLVTSISAGAMVYFLTLWLSGVRLRHITSPS
ncbi:MAG: putative peptidoglycan lipid II flippase [Gammaproteobacteria bacterium]|jgi:putative peptidoglycan lipid II flippase